ncbi:MAG: RNA polymerase sigma factor [Candidatus Latescibacterota bacterium]
MKAVIPLPDEKCLLKQEVEIVEDIELVRRFKKGNESAFTEIVNRYNKRLLNTAKVILNNEDDAMDLTQEAFVKAYFNMKGFREDSSLYTWLYRIVYNLCISHLRRKKIISFISFDHDDEVMEFHSSEPGPEKEYERKELRRSVIKAVDALPFKQRTVFTLKQIDGLTHGEIAEIMGITEGAVKASYFHAIRKLQCMLKNHGEQYDM